MRHDSKDVIVFKNRNQKVLYDEELCGQLSDGLWENTRPYDHWERLCSAKTIVGESVGLNFYPVKRNYNFANKELIECVGNRMKAYVKGSMVSKKSGMPFAFEYINDENIKTKKQLGAFLRRKPYMREYIKENEITQKMLDKFWGIEYTDKELLEDLRGIKEVFKHWVSV